MNPEKKPERHISAQTILIICPRNVTACSWLIDLLADQGVQQVSHSSFEEIPEDLAQIHGVLFFGTYSLPLVEEKIYQLRHMFGPNLPFFYLHTGLEITGRIGLPPAKITQINLPEGTNNPAKAVKQITTQVSKFFEQLNQPIRLQTTLPLPSLPLR